MDRRAMYRTPEWQELRNLALQRAGGRCEREGCRATLGPRNQFVRSKVPLEDGAPLPGLDGVEVLCGGCWRRKPVSKERAEYRDMLARLMGES